MMAVVKELNLQFAFGYDPIQFGTTLRRIAEGEIEVSPMITGEVGLDGVAGAFTDLGDPEAHAKILVVPALSAPCPAGLPCPRSQRGTSVSNKFRGLMVVVALALLASACGAKGDESGSDSEGGSSSTAKESSTSSADRSGADFGDLGAPCGKGEVKVEQSESGGSTDKLLIGVANDRSSTIRPGLNKEMWDASNAFVQWCNEQGGIGGLPIEIVDLDGKLLEIEAAMTKACTGVFMMVGGGQVQDNLQFTGKDGSDFHKCKMADIPGFAVSPEKAESNGQIQPLPHPSAQASSLNLSNLAAVDPDAAKSVAVVWGDLPAMKTIKNQQAAMVENQGAELAGVFSYPVTGLSDWTPLAKQVIDSGATAMSFVGEPTNLGALVKTLREQGWKGTPILETNAYDQIYVDSAGAANAEGSLIRSVFHPFEEADDWPAVQQYQDILEQYVPDGKQAVLGMQSFSAWLLFATVANDCAETNDDTLTRECVLKAADAVKDWTAGGLQVPTDPAPEGGDPPPCEMLIEVKADGTFERAWPKIDDEADSGDGFVCDETTVFEVPENAGLGVTSPDQPI